MVESEKEEVCLCDKNGEERQSNRKYNNDCVRPASKLLRCIEMRDTFFIYHHTHYSQTHVNKDSVHGAMT